MKKQLAAVVGVACLLAVGCASMNEGDAVRNAALKAIGSEQLAWSTNNTEAIPSGMDSVVAVTKLNAKIDNISVNGGEATALATYRYTGRFRGEGGEKSGVLTVQRKLHFVKNGTGWAQAGRAEEVARNTSWTATS